MSEIGQILRASTEGFTAGTRGQSIEAEFGAFVRTESRTNGNDLVIVGVITAIRIEDDPLVRQLIMANSMDAYPAAVRDQRENRMIPIEIDVLNVGFATGAGMIYHSLPPRPPFSLDPVTLCHSDEVLAFTDDISFFRLILNARGIASNAELLAAAISNAAIVRPPEERNTFLINAGRQVTSLLSHDVKTMDHILHLLKIQML